ncbi:uncharacterized protein LOC114291052 [Camellia sinensis]|uniref:uncharacterized protein LOC114291052 n=1 Tax=Camellia sinensis TaxID=4442 RepID=UPI001036B24F|nr:uncharacterized protein LOC114291052 [Camellia sinensis]
MTLAMRILLYGVVADTVDDYVRIGKSTEIKSLKYFCNSIIEIFGPEYLRSPTITDISRLLAIGEVSGFLGMLGSLDCIHWEWKNCPTAWQGQYVGHQKKSTIILEAVTSYDLWICHASFRMPGSHNDLNVLDWSPLFPNLTQGKAPLSITLLMDALIIWVITLMMVYTLNGQHWFRQSLLLNEQRSNILQ